MAGIAVFQIDIQDDASEVLFIIDIPSPEARDVLDASGDGHVIADIEGTNVVTWKTESVWTFEEWCGAYLRGRSKRTKAARALAIERGWMAAPAPRRRAK